MIEFKHCARPFVKVVNQLDQNKLQAFYKNLDRSYFIDSADIKTMAHLDRPLPIGYEQTISQPSLVLQMTSLLAPDKSSRVLEIGTGSGYQTALLAEFSGEVYTIERIKELGDNAREKLMRMGYDNINYKIGDGSGGWEEHAPFDRIIVTAGAGKMPQALLDQLNNNGRMVIPLGYSHSQKLLLITRDEKGKIHTKEMGNVVFVEMKGLYGWDD